MNTPPGTRERILQTARQLFHERGFSAVGINDICRDAAVVKGSFYHFFTGKQALLEAVVEMNSDRLAVGLAAIEDRALTGREQLAAQLEGVLANARAQKKDGAILGCDLGSLANELSTYNDGARHATRRAFRRWLRTLERMAQRGVDDGSLPADLDTRATASSLLAVMQGVSTLARTFGDVSQLGLILRHAQRQLLPATDD